MLDLPHYRCNQVYVPWQSKGGRRTNTWQNIIGSSPTHVHLPYTDIRLVRGQAMDSTNAMSWVSPPLGYTIGEQWPSERPGSSSQPLQVGSLLVDEASLSDQGGRSSGETPRRTRRSHERMLFPCQIRYASPERIFRCDGWCQYSEVPHPNVVSVGCPFQRGSDPYLLTALFICLLGQPARMGRPKRLADHDLVQLPWLVYIVGYYRTRI